MKIRFLVVFVLLLIASALVCAQPPASGVPSEGLDLLKRVAQHYADGKSYHIQAVEEFESHNELQRNWQKTLTEAAEAPGGRFRYEGRGGMGGAARVSDGKQVWTYHLDEHAYTASPVKPKDPNERRIITQSEFALNTAEYLRSMLAGLAKPYKSASRMPDSEIEVNGRRISCYVVRVCDEDRKLRQPGSALQETFWIEKTTETVVKRVSQGHSFLFAGGAKIPTETGTTTTYSMAELDRPIPDSVFSFTPPTDAKLLDHFPDAMAMGPSLEGQEIPQVTFKTNDGKSISTVSLRGKPVVLDIWATWCAPCVKGLEQLASLYQETKDKGLALVTIDQDEDAETASSFLAQKGYPWSNVHDDGVVEALGGTNGIPRTILIDRNGKVVYDRGGGDDANLRAAIAKLGPEFASLAPKPVAPPCGTQITAASQ